MKRIKIKGVWHYLYRAVDKHGETLDWMLSVKRDKKAAKKFFKKMLGNMHASTPSVINVDHKSVKRKSRYRQWCQSFDTASATISGMETMRMIQNGQVKYLAKNDIISQNRLSNKLVGLAA